MGRFSNLADDLAEEARFGELEDRLDSIADESVSDFKTLVDKIGREQKRNDVQTERIKALTGLCEKLVGLLLEKNVIGADQIAQELIALKQASAPKKL